jgi:hypothetical protein
MKNLLLFSLLVVAGNVSFSQTPEIIWQNSIGGNNPDFFRSGVLLADNTVLIGGASNSAISDDKSENSFGGEDYWVLNIDATGNIIWDNTIGGSADDYLKTAIPTNDGGYLIAGYSNSGISGNKSTTNIGDFDYWLIKLNADLSVAWEKNYGGAAADLLSDVKQTTDNGFIVVGTSKSPSNIYKSEMPKGGNDYWILKLDAAGNIEWDKSYGSSGQDMCNNVIITADSNYLVCGYSYAAASADKTENNHSDSSDFWILKLNTAGDIIWQNTIGGTHTDVVNDAVAMPGGGCILAGVSWSNISDDKSENTIGYGIGGDIWLVRINESGVVVWDKTIGGNGDDGAKSLSITSDNKLLIGAYSISNISGDKTESSFAHTTDYWLVKTSMSGNVIWDKTIGGADVETMRMAFEIAPTKYIIGGTSISPVSGNKTEADLGGPGDFWMVGVTDTCNVITYYADADDDGYGNNDYTTMSCDVPEGYAAANTDCDDANALIHPYQIEICNSLDDNCNGSIDEYLFHTYYIDTDDDGYGFYTGDSIACSIPEGYAMNAADCDDDDTYIHPSAIELCNFIDDDCDGIVDEGALILFYLDNDEDTYGTSGIFEIGCILPDGYVLNNDDCNDLDPEIHPGVTEICNGIDENCDSETDEGLTITVYKDHDSDDFGDAGIQMQSCDVPLGYTTDNTDCNDSNGTIHPFSVELCNSVDDDCDGASDEGIYTLYYIDNDDDGYGRDDFSILDCAAPAGYALEHHDCNDYNPAIHPNATETANGHDDNCDGLIDEGFLEITDDEIFNISIYPNPAADFIRVETTLMDETICNIYHSNGAKVMTINLEPNKTNQISISDVAAGVYLLQIQLQSGIYNSTFIKQD